MSYARDFLLIANTPPKVIDKNPRVTSDGQATIMKLCVNCNEQMPHKVGAKVCILCEMEEEVK